MSDRVVVMHEGYITGTLERSEAGPPAAFQEAIMRLATTKAKGAEH
jgi:ABC-type sugar transport system ATPase subunit